MVHCRLICPAHEEVVVCAVASVPLQLEAVDERVLVELVEEVEEVEEAQQLASVPLQLLEEAQQLVKNQEPCGQLH